MNKFKLWFKNLLQNFTQVFVRFPFACFFALALTAINSYLLIKINEYDIAEQSERILGSCAWGCAFAVILTFVAQLFNENHQVKKIFRILGIGLGIVVAAAFGLIFFKFYDHPLKGYYVCAMLFVTVLLLFVVPFFGKQNVNMQWNYLAKLFVAIAAAIVLSGVIALSFYGILASIKYLFFNGDNVIIIDFMICTTMFSFCFLAPCCTMALVPREREAYDHPLDYSKFGKVFTQYILLPLICIEGLILYLYGLKILFQWSLPEGGVAYLVFSYAIIGSIIWYLLVPTYLSEEKPIARLFQRGFFCTLIPLLVLLFVGLFRRISDYGFTPNRYIVLLMAIWFSVVSIWIIIKKTINIQPILLSLVILTMLAFVGPWNVISLPEKVQMNRFEKLATEYNILQDGKIVAAAEPLTREQNIEMSGIIDFFVPDYKVDFCEKYFGISAELIDSLNYDSKETILEKMNGKYFYYWERKAENEPENTIDYVCFVSENSNYYEVTGFNYLFDYHNGYSEEDTINFDFDNFKLSVLSNYFATSQLSFVFPQQTINIDLMKELKLLDYLDNSHESFTLKNNIVNYEDEQLLMKLYVKAVAIDKDSTDWRLSRVEMKGLVKVKE